MPGEFFKKRETRYKVSPVEERTRDGVVYSSKLEMNVAIWFEEFGVDKSSLHAQVKFILQDGFEFKPSYGKKRKIRAIAIIPDFVIGVSVFMPDGSVRPNLLVIDAKGVETPQFKLKQSLFIKRYGIEIFPVKRKKQLLELLELHNVPLSGKIRKSVVPGRLGKSVAVGKRLPKK